MRLSVRTPRWWRDWDPRTPREASESIVRNFLLHAFPARVTHSALKFATTGWLGTLALGLFLVAALTGLVLTFLYVPSVERAYASVKDIEYATAYGAWIRGTHRAAAEGMVVVVVLHLIRVFLTGAYKKEGAPGASRPLNWFVGIALLGCTLGLSFTGYLLPWDQLAYWAITVGTRIAASVPVVGEAARSLLLGGSAVGQPTLVRFYALHVVLLPAATIALVAWHMWRIRKDGGLAATDRVVDDAVAKARAGTPAAEKTYALLGATTGGTVASVSPAALLVPVTTPSVPHLVRRIVVALMGALFLAGAWGLLFHAPLERPADPGLTPNPAKAPWYFLWLQELVSDLTFRLGPVRIDGALVGGVLLPGALVTLLAAWPFLDRSPREAAGVWWHPSRKRQNVVFLAVFLAIVVLAIVGTFFRGAYWGFVSPGASGHAAPTGI